MKALLLTVILGLFSFSGLSLGKTIQDPPNELSNMLDPKNVNRLLLVAFSDNSINSIKNSASPTSYRQRGTYQSSTWSERVSDQLAEDYSLEKMAEWPMTEVGAHCVVYRLSSQGVMAEVLGRLAKDNRVDIAQSMKVFKTKAQPSNDPYFKLQKNLQQMHIAQAHGKATGKNITIGVVDTGIDLDHPDLTGQISSNHNFAKDISASFSTDKHGTAVAGVIVAKKDNAMGIIGVAPDAKLVALKACWPDKVDAIEAACNSFTLALAINTAIRSDVDILNMSLTGPKDPLLSLLLKKALEKGIIVVAAGSDDMESENFPASFNGVISVHSINTGAPNSDILTKPLSAPSEQVLTTLPYGTYDFISGSSIAAAEISGVIALLLELKAGLTATATNSILQKSKMVSKEGQVSGINANFALSALCTTETCPQDILSLAKTGF